jgi:hypothetical protein
MREWNQSFEFQIVECISGFVSPGVVMRTERNLKIPKLSRKKESVVKTQRDVSSNIAKSVGIKPDKTKMDVTAAAPSIAEVTPEERHHLISRAAYYRAEQRSFSPGYELDDWLNAEAEIEVTLLKPGVGTLAKNG